MPTSKGRVEYRVGGHADAKWALEQYEEKPEERRERLKEVLDSTGAATTSTLSLPLRG